MKIKNLKILIKILGSIIFLFWLALILAFLIIPNFSFKIFFKENTAYLLISLGLIITYVIVRNILGLKNKHEFRRLEKTRLYPPGGF